MNNRKNYNSIVFLTTLGMYLGLVLVGAAPQVLGQQSKLVVKDSRLSPCDEKELRQEASKRFAEIGLAEPYVYILPRLSSILFREGYSVIGNFAAFEIDVVLAEAKQKPESPDFKISFKKIASPANVYYTEDLLRNVGTFADITGRTGCEVAKFGCSPFELKLSLDDSGFVAQLKYTRKSSAEARKFAAAYKLSVEADRCLFSHSPLVKPRFDSTTVTARNNQVFIVTRLPRAALDSLLAKDAK